MLIKVDEDLPPIVAEHLRRAGYTASTVVEQLWVGGKILCYGVLFRQRDVF